MTSSKSVKNRISFLPGFVLEFKIESNGIPRGHATGDEGAPRIGYGLKQQMFPVFTTGSIKSYLFPPYLKIITN